MCHPVKGICIIFGLFFSAQTLSAESVALDNIMARIAAVVAQEFSMLWSTTTLDEKQIGTIQRDMAAIQSLFQQAVPLIQQRSDAYQLTLDVMLENLALGLKAAEERDYTLMRNRYRVATRLCSACHTQDQHLRHVFAGLPRDRFQSDLEYAEFNFATRHYEQAQLYFDRYIRLTKKAGDQDVIKAVQRLITIYAQVQNRPLDGVTTLRNYQELPRMKDADTRLYLQGAIEGLTQLDARMSNSSDADFAALEDLVTRLLGAYLSPSPVIHSSPAEEVQRVWLRGLLYRYLNEKAERTQMPNLLYWLAILDRALGRGDISMTDVYLKACIRRYPEHAFARLCYREYETYLRQFYTSSTQPVLPREVAEELAELRRRMPAQARRQHGKGLPAE
ncbi:MAG: hypothetical protein OEZ43_17620 [Gammaproteobacteria bacterium]|nr:hypothetical protein [Gammaproteobacteria bacterium]